MASRAGLEEPEEIDWEEWDPEQSTFLVHCLAGSLAGLAEHAGIYPIDTFKTHLQSGHRASRRSFFDFAKRFGPSRLMRGLPAVLIACVPSHAAYFSVYEAAKAQFGADTGSAHHPIAAFAAGALATTFHDAIMTPLDVVKQRMQLGYYVNVRHSVLDILHQEGAAALFRSFPTTLAMNLPFAGITVMANESIKRSLNPSGHYNLPIFLFSGALAGGLAAFVTNPMDVIKTRLQTQGLGAAEHPSRRSPSSASSSASSTSSKATSTSSSSSSSSSSSASSSTSSRSFTTASSRGWPFRMQLAHYARSPHDKHSHHLTPKSGLGRYAGVADVVKHVYEEGGVRAFFKGASARVAVTAPAAAISWGTYEAAKHLLNKTF